MVSETDFDIIVIGAGVAGLSAAYFLSQEANVLVLEQEDQPAYHSSGRSASVYIEGYENPVVAELTKNAGKFFFNPPAGFSDVPLLHDRGGMTVSGPGEEAKLEKYLSVWQPLCPNLTGVSLDAALELCPILNPDWMTAAAYDPDWKSIDTHALVTGFQRGFIANGGSLQTKAQVTALESDSRGWSVTAGESIWRAQSIVNASGAWANQIAALAGLPEKPLTPMRRTAAIVPVGDDAKTWPLVHTIAETLYFKPESPGLMVCPQDETPTEPMDAYPEDMDIAIALDHFAKATTLNVERVMSSWAGLRTFAPDRYPVVGFDKNRPDFFWLAGQGGFGVQTSPELGRLAADNILKGTPLPDAIGADRFAL